MIRKCLLAAALVLVSSMAAAQGRDLPAPGASRDSSCGKKSAPIAYRCVMVIPEIVVYGRLSDDGPGYDTQGNPIDHHGNIVAARGGRTGAIREVFVSEPRR